MLLHCTKKLAARLPDVATTPLPAAHPLGNWTANLITIDRRLCVLACHDETRFPLFLAGLRKERFAMLGEHLQELFAQSLCAAGAPASAVLRARMAMGPARYDTATDRSVLGTINQFADQAFARAMYHADNVMALDPVAETLVLAETPITVRGKWVDRPMKAMLQRVAAL